MKPHPTDTVDGEGRALCGKCDLLLADHVEEEGDRLHPRYPEEACFWARELAEPEKPLPCWRQGFVFMDADRKPYLVAPWGEGIWLFWWHPDDRWVSLRRVSIGDQLRFRQQQEACGWGDKERDHYADAHEASMPGAPS